MACSGEPRDHDYGFACSPKLPTTYGSSRSWAHRVKCAHRVDNASITMCARPQGFDRDYPVRPRLNHRVHILFERWTPPCLLLQK
jgi:hypothetical protein